MKQSIEVKAKTVHEAIAQACEQLGVPQDDVDVEILSQGGMFGKAKVLVTVKEKPAPVAEAKPVSRNATTPPAVAGTPSKEGDSPQKAASTKKSPSLEGVAPRSGDGVVIPGLKFEKTLEFITTFLKLLENDSAVTTENTDTAFNININGDNVGRLIGKGGEVLNAIQTLVSSIAISHAAGEMKRVYVNIGDYKERRSDNLVSLAMKKAEYVKSTGRFVKMDPMNSRERAIIHTALQNVEGIRTYSTGKDPFRCLCIAPGEKTPPPVKDTADAPAENPKPEPKDE